MSGTFSHFLPVRQQARTAVECLLVVNSKLTPGIVASGVLQTMAHVEKIRNFHPTVSSTPVTSYSGDTKNWLQGWFTFCFLIGVPLSGKSCPQTFVYKLHCFLCVVMDTLATIAHAVPFYYCSFATSGNFVAIVGDLLDYTIFFATTCGIHIYVIYSVNKFSTLLQKFDDESIFAGRTGRITTKASWICLTYNLITACSLATLSVLTSRGSFDCLLDYPPIYNSLLIVFINVNCLYPVAVSYTFCFLAMGLAFQFSSISHSICNDASCSGLENVRNRYVQLIKLFNELQARFSSLNFLLIIASCLTLCMGAFHTLRTASSMDSSGSHAAVGVIGLYVGEHLIRMACVCVASDFLREAAAEVPRSLAQISSADVFQRPETVTCVLLQFQALQPVVTGHGFFTIGKSLLLRVISIVLTYVFVLYQF